ncbi:MAG: sulfite exporter TauE/SafE family protein [Candidatus Eremiobacteraeota bacterium]|nr:sulfite exporter TauE/SafE family protein [Candidatus Eremiobacteraeota bacterium]
MAAYALVLIVGLVAGIVSGIIGTGSSIMLLPILVFQYGPKQAVPIMAIAAIMANVARVAAWWREVNWRAFAAYSLPGMPAAALGARTLLVLPSHVVDVALGLFFLAMIPVRRWHDNQTFRMHLWQLAIAGACIGFLTGIVLSTGPLSVPAFTSYGLMKGAFLSTEAASSLALYITKAITFRELGALPPAAILRGIIIGSSLMIGAFIGKAVVLRMNDTIFQHLLDALMLCSGLSLLWAAYTT